MLGGMYWIIIFSSDWFRAICNAHWNVNILVIGLSIITGYFRCFLKHYSFDLKRVNNGCSHQMFVQIMVVIDNLSSHLMNFICKMNFQNVVLSISTVIISITTISFSMNWINAETNDFSRHKMSSIELFNRLSSFLFFETLQKV